MNPKLRNSIATVGTVTGIVYNIEGTVVQLN